MINELTCRLCLHGQLSSAFSLDRAPRNIQNLLRRADLDGDKPIRLDVACCDTCGFIQLPPVLEESYYDDYLMATTHSLQMQEYQRNQAWNFVARFNLQGKKVLEAGCGDGSFLTHLVGAGATAFGIEPSSRFRDAAVANGHRVDSGYISSGRTIAGAPFDGFVSRQVLEHVPDIHSFLSGIRQNLADGAAGLIEVPSLEKALLDGRYYDFFADHVNYFSQDTLRLAMNMNGFDVLDFAYGMFDEYNIVLVRKRETPDVDSIKTASSVLVKDIQEYVRSRQESGQKVAIWGAGGKGLSVLASADIDSIDLLVDSDPHKQGRYTPVSHLLVQAPSRSNLQHIDAIVITAMAYRNEIEATLRNTFAFKGEIAILGQRLELSKIQ